MAVERFFFLTWILISMKSFFTKEDEKPSPNDDEWIPIRDPVRLIVSITKGCGIGKKMTNFSLSLLFLLFSRHPVIGPYSGFIAVAVVVSCIGMTNMRPCVCVCVCASRLYGNRIRREAAPPADALGMRFEPTDEHLSLSLSRTRACTRVFLGWNFGSLPYHSRLLRRKMSYGCPTALLLLLLLLNEIRPVRSLSDVIRCIYTYILVLFGNVSAKDFILFRTILFGKYFASEKKWAFFRCVNLIQVLSLDRLYVVWITNIYCTYAIKNCE